MGFIELFTKIEFNQVILFSNFRIIRQSDSCWRLQNSCKQCIIHTSYDIIFLSQFHKKVVKAHVIEKLFKTMEKTRHNGVLFIIAPESLFRYSILFFFLLRQKN